MKLGAAAESSAKAHLFGGFVEDRLNWVEVSMDVLWLETNRGWFETSKAARRGYLV